MSFSSRSNHQKLDVSCAPISRSNKATRGEAKASGVIEIPRLLFRKSSKYHHKAPSTIVSVWSKYIISIFKKRIRHWNGDTCNSRLGLQSLQLHLSPFQYLIRFSTLGIYPKCWVLNRIIYSYYLCFLEDVAYHTLPHRYVPISICFDDFQVLSTVVTLRQWFSASLL